MKDLNSIKILGEGVISAGDYNNLAIYGEASSIGDFKCNYLKVLGTLSIKEKSQAKNAKILGEVNCYDNFIVENYLSLLGTLTVSKPSAINKSKILGEAVFKDTLSFDHIDILGGLVTYKDCEGSDFYSKGKLKIKGLLSAENITINVYHNCFINEIGGSFITVKKGKWYHFHRGGLKSNLIEGDTIILENTTCGTVRGHDITILDGCNIDKIEYTGTLTKSEFSSIKEEVCIQK